MIELRKFPIFPSSGKSYDMYLIFVNNTKRGKSQKKDIPAAITSMGQASKMFIGLGCRLSMYFRKQFVPSTGIWLGSSPSNSIFILALSSNCFKCPQSPMVHCWRPITRSSTEPDFSLVCHRLNSWQLHCWRSSDGPWLSSHSCF